MKSPIIVISGFDLFHDTFSILHCFSEDFPKPVIIIHPKSTIALLRNNMSLYCTAASSSSSQMSVEWRKNKQVQFK